MVLGLGFLLALLLGIGAILLYRKVRFGSIYKYKPDDKDKQ